MFQLYRTRLIQLVLISAAISMKAAACDFDDFTFLDSMRFERFDAPQNLSDEKRNSYQLASIKVLDFEQASLLLAPYKQQDLLVFAHKQAKNRYGDLRVELGAGNAWLQKMLVSEGAAIAWFRPNNSPCFSTLLKAQQQAQQQGRGWWQRASLDLDGAAIEGLNQLSGFMRITARIAFVRSYKKRYDAYLGSKENSVILEIPKESLQLLFPRLKRAEDLQGLRIDAVALMWQERYGPRIMVNHAAHITKL